jgi:endonuclease G
MTNNHVIASPEFARNLVIQFNYQYDLDGETLLRHVTYELDPDSFFLTSSLNGGLDFTIIRVKPRSDVSSTSSGTVSNVLAGTEFGFLRLGTDFLFSQGQQANIIQHPDGGPKQIAIRNNDVTNIFQEVIRYTSDTQPGSSGSPVFNNRWRLIALHHSAGEESPPGSGTFLNNEAIRIDKIIDFIRTNASPAIVVELGL